ncbi:nucleoside deaminase [Virgibacillus soli]|uniref:Nucleoside deaminase n=1 Tax=Paracerasibacillus soli TaxID=480284 RepID=A0ABU5CY17_9BACI|nr:nucleoside deaminase [Virgibacillus soli]MDY0410380.1 nucleoside deaminase [Virgibacillus soli]
MDKFMKRAVELSTNNVKDGGQPFGAVLVKDGAIVAEGVNEIHIKHDVSAHAELVAIRKAQEKLQTDDLSGYVMYASGEPCPMCFTAMYYVGIKKAYYCASVKETADNGLNASAVLYEDFKHATENRKTVEMIHMPLEEGLEDPMKMWLEKDEVKKG